MWQQIQFALSDSAHRVLVQLASFLPGVIAFLLAVLVLSTLGWGLSILLRRILQPARFDERLSHSNASTSLSDWSPSNSPTLLVTRIVFWAFIVLGIIIGLSAFDASYASNSSVAIFILPYLTHSVGAILLLFVGNLIARFLARSVLIGAVNARLQYARFLSLGVKWLVLVLTAAMVLDHIGVGGTVVELAFGILFGGIVLTLALAIGLGPAISSAARSSATQTASPRSIPRRLTPATSLPNPSRRSVTSKKRVEKWASRRENPTIIEAQNRRAITTTRGCPGLISSFP